MLCDELLACDSMAWLACDRMLFLVKLTISAAMSLNSAGTIALTNNDVGTNRGVKITTTSTDVLAVGAGDTTGGGATVGTNMTVTVNGQSVAAGDIDGSKVAISAASGPNL